MTLSEAELLWIKDLSHEIHDVSSLLADIACQIRYDFNNDDVVRFAVDYIAPCYISYVKFILDDAKKRGIDRLYFVNRDAWILFKIAESFNIDNIDLRYLFVSRKSLASPFLKDFNPRKFKFITGLDGSYIINNSLNEIYRHLDLTEEAARRQYGLNFAFDRIESETEENVFLESVLSNAKLRKDIIKKGEIQYNLLVGYLKQEGLFDLEHRCAIVDVGWLGTTRAVITDIFKENDSREPLFYYFGVFKENLPIKYGNYVNFLNPDEFPEQGAMLVENYLSLCPYGTTLFYQKSNGAYIPVLSEKLDDKRMHTLEMNLQGCLKFAEKLNYEKSLRQIDDSVLKKWCLSSIRCLLRFDDRNINFKIFEAACKPLVSRLKVKDIFSFLTHWQGCINFFSLFYSFPYPVAKLLFNFHPLIYRTRLFIKHHIGF